MDDLYFTIERPARAEIKRKGSRFIAEAVLSPGVDEAVAQLAAIRKREHAASHHCYAYRIGLGDDLLFKYSDDGEPTGTAGRPIFDLISGRDLTNLLLVVTRYFGGTKLGTGGLARAYSDAAAEALEQAGRRENYITRRFRITIPFPLYDALMKLIGRFQAKQRDGEFSDHVVVELEVRVASAASFVDEVVQLSSGKAVIEAL